MFKSDGRMKELYFISKTFVHLPHSSDSISALARVSVNPFRKLEQVQILNGELTNKTDTHV